MTVCLGSSASNVADDRRYPAVLVRSHMNTLQYYDVWKDLQTNIGLIESEIRWHDWVTQWLNSCP